MEDLGAGGGSGHVKPVEGRTVFLSYAHTDAEFARRIETFLKKRGAAVWLDERSAAPGEFLTSAIGEGLANASAVVLVLSKASVASRWVQYEIDTVFPRVVSGECRLVPVLIDAVDIPTKLGGLIYADFRTPSRVGFQRLARGLDLQTPRTPSKVSSQDTERAADELLARPGASSGSQRARPFKTREAFLIEALTRVFNRTELWELPRGGPTNVNFSRGAEADDIWFVDDVEVYYEPPEDPATPWLGTAPRIWPPVLKVDDDYIFNLQNECAGQGGSYYHLLLADRPVQFTWPVRPLAGDDRVQIDGLDRVITMVGEPGDLWVSIDATGIKNRARLEKYLRAAREAFRQHGQRCVIEANEKWPGEKPWEERWRRSSLQ